MRNHDIKYESFECGEGPTCEIWNAIGSIGSALVGGLLGRQDASDYNEAMAARTEAARPSIEVWGPAAGTAENILSEAERLYGAGRFAPQANPLELLGIENQLGYAEGLLPELVADAQNAWLTALDPEVSKYIKDEIALEQGLLGERFVEDVLPFIATNAQAAGGYGGARQGIAEGQSAEGLLRAQSELATRMLSQAYQQELQSQMNAINQAGQMSLLGYLPGQGQEEAGGKYRAQAARPAENLTGYQALVNPYTQPRIMGGGAVAPYTNPNSAMLAGGFAGADMWKKLGGIFGNPANVPSWSAPGDAYQPAQTYYSRVTGPGPFGY